MEFNYSLFGLRLQSNQPIVGLAPLAALSAVDVTMSLDGLPSSLLESDPPQRPWYVSSDRDRRGQSVLTIWKLRADQYYRLLFSDGAQFLVHRSGQKIWAHFPKPLTREDAAAYLLGPIMSLLLLLRGTTCLHASAVSVNGQAVLFAGPSGCGKSTAAALLAGRGAAVLTDDLAALSHQAGVFCVQPGFPWLRLRPPSIEVLESSAARPALCPTNDGCYVDLTLPQQGYQARSQATPIGLIYLMEEPRIVERRKAPRLGNVENLNFLMANTWTARILDRSMRAHEFEVLSRLARNVPLRRLARAQVATLLEKVRRDMRTAGAGRHTSATAYVMAPQR